MRLADSLCTHDTFASSAHAHTRRARRQDVLVRTYGARRSPLDVLAPSALLQAALAAADERAAFAHFCQSPPRPRL